MLSALLPFRGEIAALVAAFIWAGSITIYSRIGRKLPALSLNLYKNTFGIFCFLVLMLFLREPWPSHNTWPILSLIASGFLGLTLGDSFFFNALKRCGAQVSTAMECLGPVFAAMLAWMVRGETLSSLQWTGVIITLMAILMVIQGQAWHRHSQPSNGLPKASLASGIAFAIASALVNGASIVVAREGFAHFSVVQGTTLRIAAGTLGLAAVLRIRGERPAALHKILNRKHFGFLLLASFAGAFVALLLLSIGITYTKAGIASALSSTYPIWIVPLSWFVLKEKSHPLSLLGTLVAVGGMTLLFLS